MTRGKEHYKNKIIEESPVMVFTATNTAMMEYPYVLGKPTEKSPTLADQADIYIMDSHIGDEDVTNERVVEEALSVGADVVVPSDVLHDTEKTTQTVADMERRIEETDLDMIVPIQTDERLSRVEHCKEIDTFLDQDIEEYWIGVGGIKDMPIENQIIEVFQVREAVGKDAHIHAFGCGVSHDWAVAMREMPSLVDSVDTSAVYQIVGSGKTMGRNLETSESPLPRGKHSTCLSALRREEILHMFNHLIGPSVREEDAPTEFKSNRLKEVFEDV